MTSTLATQVKQILSEAVNATNGPAGLVFGAINRNGKVLVAEAVGKRAIDKDEPMTVDSYFPLYSVTKTIVGIAVMQLVEQGKVSLDEPVEKILPEIANVKLLKDDLTLVEPKTKITLRMLLSHTAGFSYTFFNHKLRRYWEYHGGPDEFQGTKEGILDMPLVNEPGTRWEYGVNIDWAGEVVARVSGLSLSEYCAKYIFEPLGIQDVTFAVPAHFQSKLVTLHGRKPDGSAIPIDHLPFIQSSTFDSGGAGSFGTLTAFLTAVVPLINNGVGTNGTRILKEETVKQMFEDQVGGLPGLHETIPGARPDLSNDIPTPAGMRKGWGLTFSLNLDPLPTGRSASSGQWAGLPNLYFSVDPTKGVATMIMCQQFPFADPMIVMTFLAAESAVYGSLQSAAL
ncbi:beta-lactamase/transpeptidase-like protein [Exidia glandulosa HHB12029]|uniref:Beta-lactamase/transpeptidase-like protein n=1 Tax=Exidia glandulosa HHB12029 TaxID=1314781 RepID=A0A165LUM2_EXIGL|nr:beta-lactamase/transpeptidase-like protein [Exidia glandulosa HHB12029]